MKTINKLSKRVALKVLAGLPCLASCSGGLFAKEQANPQQRFKGIGVILVTDAVPGTEMHKVVFSDDEGRAILSPALVARNNKKFMALGSMRMPQTVRAVWRKGAGWDNIHKVWNPGEIIGDYTIPVAERIPDTLLEDIRSHGGALRLKFRLKPDGVLLGWDIERSLPIPGCDPKANATCMGTYFFSPGGDFLETRY